MALSFRYEKKFWNQGLKYVAGVDEVGRGPLAGPIVAAAVIFRPKTCIKGIDDSKKLSEKQRARLFLLIQSQALSVGIALLDHKTIDKINIGKANLLVLKMAVENLQYFPEHILIDGLRTNINLPFPQTCLVEGDRKCASIAAASIVAKVTRDRMMLAWHAKYPLYGFDRHKGYGTKEHFAKLKKHGPCPIHRRSFSPVSSLT